MAPTTTELPENGLGAVTTIGAGFPRAGPGRGTIFSGEIGYALFI